MDGRSARAALIMAVEPAEAAGLRATLPLLGATLVERQVRQALAAGAGHAIILVATMPAELLAALDRLRRDGAAVEVARSIADAADRLHPDEAVLLVGDGCLAPQPLVERMIAAAPPALLVRAAGAELPFERLDAAHGWAGLALVDGALVRRTASAPGDWDAQSTLLRRAVQAGAARIEAGEAPPHLLRAPPPRAGVEPVLVAASRAAGGAWTRRWLFPPVETPLVRLLAPRAVDPRLPAALAAALGVAAAALAARAWPWPALAAFLLSGPLAAAAARLARFRLARLRGARLFEALRTGGGAAALLLVAARLPDWGWTLAAAVALAAMAALVREAAMLRARGGTVPAAAADADALAWVALGGAAAADWPAAVGAAAGYALLSFALVQDRAARMV